MGIEKLLSDKIKAGQKKRLAKKQEAAKTAVKQGLPKPKKDPSQKKKDRQPYEEEAKVAKKKPTRIRLTPLAYDDPEYVAKAKTVSEQRSKLADAKRRKGVLPEKKVSKKKVSKKEAVVEGKKKKSAKSADGAKSYDVVLPTPEEEARHVVAQAIVGQSDTGMPDPLEGLSLPSNELVSKVAEAKAARTMNEDQLLQRAHNYFNKLNADDQRRNRQAFQRLREMKRINRQGGDKDGFKFVIPKSVTTIVRQIAAAEGVEGADVDPETLSSNFIGDGVAETSAKPMRSYKARKQCFDDFYQFQVAKKWTKNAESFLARGRMTKKMFTTKQGQNRSIRKM